MRNILAVLAICLPLTGCYLVQAASGQLDVLARSHPIAAVVDDPATAPDTRAQLALVREAREFAVRELDLPDGRSFRSYADLGRPYAVWNIVATPEFSVEPRRWCFPVAGCVSYRGYFDQDAARREARRLASRGDDVSLGGVATYSTLGHLPDPVFNTMLGWRESRLVGTIFHELAHERIYVTDDSEFNEAFASVLEAEGIRRWYVARDQAAELVAWERQASREREFAALLRDARARLERLYASGLPPGEMRVEKQRELGRLKFAYAGLRASWDGFAGYDDWFGRLLNNAHLAAVATYHDCVPGLARELEAAGSMPAFYERMAALAGISRAERHAAVCGKGDILHFGETTGD
jgi:predicted aminopeptidase